MNSNPYMEAVDQSADYLCGPMEAWARNGFVAGLLGMPNDGEVLSSGEYVPPAEHLVDKGKRLIGRNDDIPKEEFSDRLAYLQATLNEVLQRQKDAMALRSSMVSAGAFTQYFSLMLCIVGSLGFFPSPMATAAFASFAALYFGSRNLAMRFDKKLFDVMKAEKHPGEFLPWMKSEVGPDWPPNIIMIPHFPPPVFNPALAFNSR